jgi:hypothetical protein
MRLPALLFVAMSGSALLGAAGYAALPTSPALERLAAFGEVIRSDAMRNVFQADLPIRIEFVRDDLYRVSGARCLLDMRRVLQPRPPGLVGPADYRMEEVARRCD